MNSSMRLKSGSMTSQKYFILLLMKTPRSLQTVHWQRRWVCWKIKICSFVYLSFKWVRLKTFWPPLVVQLVRGSYVVVFIISKYCLSLTVVVKYRGCRNRFFNLFIPFSETHLYRSDRFMVLHNAVKCYKRNIPKPLTRSRPLSNHARCRDEQPAAHHTLYIVNNSVVTANIQIVRECQKNFGFELPSVILDKRCSRPKLISKDLRRLIGSLLLVSTTLVWCVMD